MTGFIISTACENVSIGTMSACCQYVSLAGSWCREAMQRLTEAVEDYRQASVLDPKSIEAQSKLAVADKQLLSASVPP